MGIKGIYGEIGPGERKALSKLAVDRFEETGRPFRIAIDISIWNFQTQSGKGGKNPALRTLYYRLLRLLQLSIQPLFVFDGPNKPPVKRNARTGQHAPSLPDYLSKQLLKFFGFPFHMAPGEAEAECALLQKQGIVDAVFSEDVDTLMFGCGLSMRNWSSEGNSKRPTHVDVYDAERIKQGRTGLDKEGMVLVALLSGGDYVTEGVPGCGVKIACEAARAGLGKEICALSPNDSRGRRSWRDKLAHEFQTNESKYFKARHKVIKLPEKFPSRAVLGYYTHPVVSSANAVEKIRSEILWNQEINIPALRAFVAEAFDWTFRSGAVKFVRTLAPALLIHKLQARGEEELGMNGSQLPVDGQGLELIKAICGRRTHWSSDGAPEIRVVYVPADIVGLDMDAEEPDPEFDKSGETTDDDVAPLREDENPRGAPRSPSKPQPQCTYDPIQPQKDWILETYVKIGAPLMMEDWEESQRNPKTFIRTKADAKIAAFKKKPVKKTSANGGMKKGALDTFVKIRKPGVHTIPRSPAEKLSKPRLTDEFTEEEFPPLFLAPNIPGVLPPQPSSGSNEINPRASTVVQTIPCPHNTSPNQLRARQSRVISSNKASNPSSKRTSTPTQRRKHTKPPSKLNGLALDQSSPSHSDLQINPWTISRRTAGTSKVVLARSARYSALCKYGPTGDSSKVDVTSDVEQNNTMLPSPTPSFGPWLLRRYHRSPSSSSYSNLENELEPQARARRPLSNKTDSDDLVPSLPAPRSDKSPSSPAKDLGVNRKLKFNAPKPTQTQPLPSDIITITSSPAIPTHDTFHSPALPPIQKPKKASTPPIMDLLPSSSPMIQAESLSPNRHKTTRFGDGSPTRNKRRRSRRLIALRLSQEGAWKEQICEGTGRSCKKGEWRMSQVELLDMTQGS